MGQTRERTLADRLRDLLEAIKEALSPRQPVPAPVPTRDVPRRR